MYKSQYDFDTPALVIDQDVMMRNVRAMQEKANAFGLKLRPHTKTHKMPELARLQVSEGACGITVAKVGEAEVMAHNGLTDIFIANVVVGVEKLERIRRLSRIAKLRLGVDNTYQVDQLQHVFSHEQNPIEVLIEIEVGEKRCGVITDEQLVSLAEYIKTKDKVSLVGVFSHEGHTYGAKDVDDCISLALEAQARTVQAANILRGLGVQVEVVSIGATPSLMHAPIAAGITEIRPGTYILMDAGQGNAINSYDSCAAVVLATVISKPTDTRVVIDAGAKALTAQNRGAGICHTPGNGLVRGPNMVRLSGVYDEHGLINNKDFGEQVAVGDKIEVIPNHICPTCNLYEKAYLVSQGRLVGEIPVLCRGKLT